MWFPRDNYRELAWDAEHLARAYKQLNTNVDRCNTNAGSAQVGTTVGRTILGGSGMYGAGGRLFVERK